MSSDGYCCTPDSGDCCGPGSWCCARAGDHSHDAGETFSWQGHIAEWREAYSREHFRALVEATPTQESQDAKILTASCRFTGLNHSDCAGHIYLGSIFGDASNCECDCHHAD